MGVPVVTSRLGANGVDAVAGEHLLVAGSHAEYAETILRILDHLPERQRLAHAGRQRMLTHHNWESSMCKLDTILDRCIRKRALEIPIRNAVNTSH